MNTEMNTETNPHPHTIRPLDGGGMVLVLNTGAKIPPEAEAMIQALYSRDPRSVLEHLKIVAEKGWSKFMESYYVGYGHKSIGDCGTTTIFIEGVSMLAAKAIQDLALYSGQEVSTRYVDFATVPFIDPIASELSKQSLEDLRAFYLEAMTPLRENLKRRYPKNAEEKETVYEKAINARAFDILRGFLPAGASTSLAWHTNLRQAADHLMHLRHHPLSEVRALVEKIEEALVEAFPSSFGHKKYEATEEYNRGAMARQYYHTDTDCPDFALAHDGIEREVLEKFQTLLKNRPPKTELPKYVGEAGTLRFRFLLDFGSYRDLQRHRAVGQRMPLLTTTHGFETWYLEELPKDLREKANVLLEKHEENLAALAKNSDPFALQYFIPMGYRIACSLRGDLPALVYLAELRSSSTVHPTLQKRAREMAKMLGEMFQKYEMVIHTETTEMGRFDTHRGTQDIVKKE